MKVIFGLFKRKGTQGHILISQVFLCRVFLYRGSTVPKISEGRAVSFGRKYQVSDLKE
jgi:hypothetical protein